MLAQFHARVHRAVRRQTPARSLAFIQNLYVPARIRQDLGSAETGHTGPDNDGIEHGRNDGEKFTRH